MGPQAWWQIIVNVLTELGTKVVGYIPHLIGALVILIVGVVISKLAQWVITKLLKRVGFDRLAEKIGISKVAEGARVKKSASELAGLLIFWVLFIIFLIPAMENLGLSMVAGMLIGLVGYLPNVLAAVLSIIIGVYIARLAADLADSVAAGANVSYHKALGQGIQYVIIVFVVLLALGQLGIDTDILIMPITIVLGAAGLALAIACGVGGREMARNVIAGLYVRGTFQPGQSVFVEGHSGVIQSVDVLKTVVQSGEERISIPNSALTDQQVTV